MKIAIIGGGIAGLSAAYYLQRHPGVEIEIYEKENDVGGLAGVIPLEDTYIEKYYHHIFTHDNYYLELVKDLGLDDKLIWKESKVGYYFNGISYPFTSAMDLLKFRPLTFINRIRLGAGSIIVSKYKNVSKLESISTEEFMVKVFGQQVWEVIWKPMLKIKFGDNYNKIPGVWIWERIFQRFKSRSGGGQKELLGYMQGSFRTFNQKLLEAIIQKGAKVHLNSEVSEIVIKDNNCNGIVVNSKNEHFDRVICTASLPVFVDLCKQAPANYIEPLKQVKYDCTLVVLLMLNKKLSDIYWLNISDNEIPFGGLIEHTNFIPTQSYNGKHVVYFSKYLNVKDPLLKKTDEEIMSYYLKYIKQIYPNFNEANMDSYYVSRDRYAQPIWPMNYSKIKPDYETPVKGLYLANTSQIYPNDRGMNFSVKLGKEVVETMYPDHR